MVQVSVLQHGCSSEALHVNERLQALVGAPQLLNATSSVLHLFLWHPASRARVATVSMSRIDAISKVSGANLQLSVGLVTVKELVHNVIHTV